MTIQYKATSTQNDLNYAKRNILCCLLRIINVQFTCKSLNWSSSCRGTTDPTIALCKVG